jgi:drug/metabolite transporter (DMT)-like permease
MRKGSLVVIYLKLFMTAVFWGGTFIAGRVIAQHVMPFSAAFLRFVIATVFLLLLTRKQEGKFSCPTKQQVFPLILLGLTGIFAYNAFFFKGLKLIEAGRASVIVANNPIFIALCSAYFFKERLTPLKVTGILLSVTGAVIAITRGQVLEIVQGKVGLGELYIFGCVVSWVTYSLIGKAVMKNLSPLLSVTYSVIVGVVALSLPAYFEGVMPSLMHYPISVWFSLFYLGFCGTVLGFVWYYQGIQQIGPTRAGLFINFVPVSAIFMAFAILGEPITFSLIIGVLLVSSGVYLTNKKPEKPK